MGIIHCGGIIRSGSTLQFNIVWKIVEETQTGRHIHTNEKGKELLARNWGKDLWLVNKGHTYRDYHVHGIAQGKFKLLLTYRDLRDVMVSTVRFRKKPFEEILPDFHKVTIGREAEWLKQIPAKYIYRAKYENFVYDVDNEISRIADFLGIALTAKQHAKVLAHCSLQHNREYVSRLNNMCAHTRFGPGHIGGVKHGQWQEHLTSAQVQQVMSLPGIKEWMEKEGYI